jgi:septal ring factor EnvC (AmiA/AmiB activator)
VVPARARKDFVALGAAAALLCALLAAVLATAPRADAADAGTLEAKLASARDEAGSMASGLRASRERLAVAEGEATAAAAREERLSGLLAEGQERAAELSRQLAATRDQLDAEKARLRRSRAALATRLVAIYESGTPSTASLVFSSGDYQELITRTNYLRAIEESDSALADRVEQVRDEVRKEAKLVAELEARAVAYDERLAAARAQIASARAAAQAAAARQQSIAAEREASLADLESSIGKWVKEVQEARAAEGRDGAGAGGQRPVRANGDRALARRPLLDPDLHRDVRVRRRLRCRQPLFRSRRRLPDPALDLGALRRPGRSSRRLEG